MDCGSQWKPPSHWSVLRYIRKTIRSYFIALWIQHPQIRAPKSACWFLEFNHQYFDNMNNGRSNIRYQAARDVEISNTVEPQKQRRKSIIVRFSRTNRLRSKRPLLNIDLVVLPILFLLFLVSFMDRSNLATAKIKEFEKCLRIPPKSNES